MGKDNKSVIETTEHVVETEIHDVTAHISLPHEGGWGWVVVMSTFFSLFVLDGVAYTFGSMLSDIAKDISLGDSLTALVNSTAVALYFTASPFASALINSYGFRVCSMSGSVVCALALCLAQFSTNFTTLFLSYGILGGFGFCLINMSSSLIVGFYFQKLRSVALAIAMCGSSLGVMILYPANALLVQKGGWRPTTLLHSGLFGIIFFLGMTYRPVVPFLLQKDAQTSTRTLVYLPSASTFKSASSAAAAAASKTPTQLFSTPTERLFNAVSNINFPTAASVIKEVSKTTDRSSSAEQGTSKFQSKSRMTLTSKTDGSTLTRRQLKVLEKIESVMLKTSEPCTLINIQIKTPPSVKKSMWKRIFHWPKHNANSRPMYRDDVFYDGDIKHLQAYKKTITDTLPKDRTGLEYQMAVTRVAGQSDLLDRRGLCNTAVRRVLATMIDPSLLKKTTFLLMCSSGLFTYIGFLVPYVYLQDRNLKAGINPKHCTMFISIMGLSNAIGRLVLGSLASKLDPIILFAFWCSIAGLSTIMSSLSYSIYYQYAYCCIFGFSISSVACLRSLILVSLYGLDKLTNATGMLLIFLGLGNMLSTPLAGLLKDKFGYEMAFYVAGGFMTLSGLLLVLVKNCAKRERNHQETQSHE